MRVSPRGAKAPARLVRRAHQRGMASRAPPRSRARCSAGAPRAPPALRAAPLDEAGPLQQRRRGRHRDSPQAFAGRELRLGRPEKRVRDGRAGSPTRRPPRQPRAPRRPASGRRCAPPRAAPASRIYRHPSCQARRVDGERQRAPARELGQPAALAPLEAQRRRGRPRRPEPSAILSHSTPRTPHDPAIRLETS